MRTEPREHQSIYEGGHSDWREGFTCDECSSHRQANLDRFANAKAPGFNIGRLISDNRAHVTQYGLHKEIVETAKREGKEDEIGMRSRA